MSDVFSDVSPPAFLEAEPHAVIAEEIIPATRSLPLSGHWRTGLGGGLWRRSDGATTPVVQLDEAGLLELLGEQRLRGIGAPVGVRMLEGSVTFAPSLVPQVVQTLHAGRVDSIAPPPPYPKWKEHWLRLRVRHRLSRVALAALASGGAGCVARRAGDHARHLLNAGAGPAPGRGDPTDDADGGRGDWVVARVGLKLQWPGGA